MNLNSVLIISRMLIQALRHSTGIFPAWFSSESVCLLSRFKNLKF